VAQACSGTDGVTNLVAAIKKRSFAYDINYGARSVVNQVHHVAIQLLAQAQIEGLIPKNGSARLILNEVSDIVLDANRYNLSSFSRCTYPPL